MLARICLLSRLRCRQLHTGVFWLHFAYLSGNTGPVTGDLTDPCLLWTATAGHPEIRNLVLTKFPFNQIKFPPFRSVKLETEISTKRGNRMLSVGRPKLRAVCWCRFRSDALLLTPLAEKSRAHQSNAREVLGKSLGCPCPARPRYTRARTEHCLTCM